MHQNQSRPGVARLLGAVGLAATLLVAACGGGTATPGASVAPPPAGSAPAGSPGGSGGYSGPEATIEYSIWGDPAELRSQPIH